MIHPDNCWYVCAHRTKSLEWPIGDGQKWDASADGLRFIHFSISPRIKFSFYTTDSRWHTLNAHGKKWPATWKMTDILSGVLKGVQKPRIIVNNSWFYVIGSAIVCLSGCPIGFLCVCLFCGRSSRSIVCPSASHLIGQYIVEPEQWNLI